MTTEEKANIIRLKEANLTVTVIAEKLSLSSDSVKKCLQRYYVPGFRYCKCCGALIPASGKRVFCSKKCKDKYWSSKVNQDQRFLKEFTCTECGKSFLAHHSRGRLFCSRFCFRKHELKKWRECNENK